MTPSIGVVDAIDTYLQLVVKFPLFVVELTVKCAGTAAPEVKMRGGTTLDIETALQASESGCSEANW
jgi:hypothetical protein